MAEKMLKPSLELMLRVRQAFLDYGYSGLNMVTLARGCGFTRRSLYNYFNNKENAFRASIAYDNALFVQNGMDAGEEVRRAGGSALDILSAIMDVRYGFTPHIVELNAEAFKLCRDIMIATATEFQGKLESLLLALEKEGKLALSKRFTARQVAQMLADGGRAVNQALPPPTSEELTDRYRQLCEAILFGSASVPEKGARKRAAKARNGA
jgi:AcrR family transcriptional regulator